MPLPKTFIITYTVLNQSGSILKEGKMRVKNKSSSCVAQFEFEKFLKKKYKDFGKLIIHKCSEDFFSGMFNYDILDKSPFDFR